MTRHQIKLRRARGRTRRLNQAGLNRRGRPLVHRKWRWLDRLGLCGKEREEMRRKLIREENKRDGLTVRGTVRIRRQWPGLKGKSKTEINTIRHRDWLQRRRYALGLTARGTQPLGGPSELELQWRELRVAMNIRVPELLTIAERAEAA